MQEEEDRLQETEEYDIYLEHPRSQPLLFFMAIGRDRLTITLGSKIMKALPTSDMLGIKS